MTPIEKTLKVLPENKKLDDIMCETKDYVFVDLEGFCPEDRLKRRTYINNIKLSVPVVLYRVAFGGAVGTHNFLWCVPEKDGDMELNMKVVTKINKSLPKYCNRAVKRQFLNKYAKHIHAPKSLLRSLFYELTGFEPCQESADVSVGGDRQKSNTVHAV